MSSPSHPFYSKTLRCLVSIHDLTHPEAEERLQREQAAWLQHAHVEQLTAEASVLIVQPGGAKVDAGCSFPRIHLLHGSVHKAGCEMYGTNYPQEALWMLSHSLARM